MSDTGVAYCPECGSKYDIKYPKRAFTPDKTEATDRTCRHGDYVHVHKGQ